MSQAEAALTEAWKAELERTQQQSDAKVAELEAQVVRLMTQMEDTRREDARTVRGMSEGIGFIGMDGEGSCGGDMFMGSSWDVGGRVPG